MDNLTPEELRRRRARRERRGNQVAGAIRNARLSVAPGPSAVGPALGRELPRQPQKPPAKGLLARVIDGLAVRVATDVVLRRARRAMHGPYC